MLFPNRSQLFLHALKLLLKSPSLTLELRVNVINMTSHSMEFQEAPMDGLSMEIHQLDPTCGALILLSSLFLLLHGSQKLTPVDHTMVSPLIQLQHASYQILTVKSYSFASNNLQFI